MGYKNVSYMLIGGCPGLNIFEKLIKQIAENIKNRPKSHGNKIMEITGPKVLQKILGEIFKKITFQDGFFEAKDEDFYTEGGYSFYYTRVKIQTKTEFYKKLQRDNRISPYYKYNFI